MKSCTAAELYIILFSSPVLEFHFRASVLILRAMCRHFHEHYSQVATHKQGC